MNLHKIGLIICILLLFLGIFSLGWASSAAFIALNYSNEENPGLFGAEEKISPSNHVKQEQIHVYQDRIVIDLQDANWAYFTDTNSMDPLFDKEANSFEIKPESAENVNIGDIISYKSEYSDGLIVHRVVDKSEDLEGIYFIAQGDNLTQADPGKIRFEQIHGVLVGIIY